MEYTPTNRERNRDAQRRRMKVNGRGLLTVVVPTTPAKVTQKMVREAKKGARHAARAA